MVDGTNQSRESRKKPRCLRYVKVDRLKKQFNQSKKNKESQNFSSSGSLICSDTILNSEMKEGMKKKKKEEEEGKERF